MQSQRILVPTLKRLRILLMLMTIMGAGLLIATLRKTEILHSVAKYALANTSVYIPHNTELQVNRTTQYKSPTPERLPSAVLSLKGNWTNTNIKAALSSPKLNRGTLDDVNWKNHLFLSSTRNLLKARLNPTHWKQLDIMKFPPYKLDPEFRNPCWRSNATSNRSCGGRKETGTPDSNLRCLPYFMIIGEVKCGTTDLWDRLLRHPDIVESQKEIQWVGRSRYRMYPRCTSIDTYLGMLQPGADKILQRHQLGVINTHVTGEGTPEFLATNEFWDLLPGNEDQTEPRYLNAHYVHHLIPGARIIVALRDPVNRLLSHYMYSNRAAGRRSTNEHFLETIKRGIGRFETCLETNTLRTCCYDYTMFDYLNYGVDLTRSIYHVFLEDWFKLYPREQIHIHRLEDYSANRTDVISQLYNFLGLRTIPLADIEKTAKGNVVNEFPTKLKQSMGPMWNSTRRLLEDFYEPYTRKLAVLLNDQKYLWYLNPSGI